MLHFVECYNRIGKAILDTGEHMSSQKWQRREQMIHANHQCSLSEQYPLHVNLAVSKWIILNSSVVKHDVSPKSYDVASAM